MKNWPYGVRVVIGIILMIVGMMIVWCPILCKGETYSQTFVVIDTDYINDVLIMMDFNGNVWEWEGVEDWFIGEIASAIMDDCETSIIHDDEIISLRYDGWLDGWFERVCM